MSKGLAVREASSSNSSSSSSLPVARSPQFASD